MNTEDMIRELRNLYEQHKDDKYSTFAIRWNDVCCDVANKLEELQLEIQKRDYELFVLKNNKNIKQDCWSIGKPPEEEMLLVSVKDETGDISNHYTAVGFHYKDAWIVDNKIVNNVNGWKKFPEPSKGKWKV